MTIVIENDANSVRKGIDKKTGKTWETIMPYPYGYIKGTKGIDGDEVDAFVGPVKGAKFVYIIHQTNNNSGEWDEDKVMLGFNHAMDAIHAYRKAYDRPDHFYASTTTMSIPDFKKKVFGTKEDPKMIFGGSRLDTVIALHCANPPKNPFSPGDQVAVDGMHGRGTVYSVDGRRCVVRFANGLYLSRDFIYLHNLSDRVKGMWHESQKQH